jgi:hypothetical protein
MKIQETTMQTETLGRYGHHPDQEIDTECEVDRLQGLLYEARAGLEVALGFNTCTPNGLYIKSEIRRIIEATKP